MTPPSKLRVDGWDTIELTLVHNLYKSPAWPVGPRDFYGVRATLRRPTDGAVRVVLRSALAASFPSPSGYTRSTVECGGYDAIPRGPEETLMKYGPPPPPHALMKRGHPHPRTH